MTHVESPDDPLPVSELIRRTVADLPRAEGLVGRALLLRSPTIGLESSSRLAEIVGTSGPTVIRFVNRLGFATYADFQRAWREELDARLVSPVDAFRSYEPESDAAHRLRRTASHTVDAIDQTVARIPPGEFETAVTLLAERRRVLVFGGWFSDVLARHLAALLRTARAGVDHLDQPPVQRATSLLDAGRRDVAVVFDFRRYEQDSLVAARHLADRGATVVLVTDQWISPIAGVAGAVLIARAAPSPLDAMAPALTLCQALAAAVVDRLGPEVSQRIAHLAEVSATLIPNWSAPGE